MLSTNLGEIYVMFNRCHRLLQRLDDARNHLPRLAVHQVDLIRIVRGKPVSGLGLKAVHSVSSLHLLDFRDNAFPVRV